MCVFFCLFAKFLSFIAGMVMGSFYWTLRVFLGGVAVIALLIIPDYPFYNRHSPKWLDRSSVRPDNDMAAGVPVDESQKSAVEDASKIKTTNGRPTTPVTSNKAKAK